MNKFGDVLLMLFLILFLLYVYQESSYLKTIDDNILKVDNRIERMQDQLDTQNRQLKEQKLVLDNLQKELRDSGLLNELSLFEATAYTSHDKGCNTITATGTTTTEGRTIAVDTNKIPLGSKVYIKSDYPGISGVYIAEDTGGAIRGNRIDICMDSVSRAMEFGRRDIRVKVLGGYK